MEKATRCSDWIVNPEASGIIDKMTKNKDAASAPMLFKSFLDRKNNMLVLTRFTNKKPM